MSTPAENAGGIIPSIPHFQYPPGVGGDGHLLTVGQDTEEEILGCVYMAAKTPQGTRLYAPEFGIDDRTFNQSPVPIFDLQAQILASEPRVDIDAAAVRQLMTDIITLGVSNIG